MKKNFVELLRGTGPKGWLLSYYFKVGVFEYRLARLPLTCPDGKERLHHTLTLDQRLPRVDVHVHLAVDPVRDPKAPGAAKRFHDLLSGKLAAYQGKADEILHCELEDISALMGNDPLGSLDLARLVRHGLLNEAYQNVPAVLGAASWGGKDGPLNRPALIVALAADFSQTPVLRDGGDTRARLALAARSALLAYLSVTQAPPRWYGQVPQAATCVGWSRSADDGVAELEAVLEEHRWLTRISGGAVVGFAGYDPRTPHALERLKTWIMTRKSSARGLVGIKCYSRCGWAASVNSGLYREDGDELDERVKSMATWAAGEGIPVTNLHTPGGWPALGQLLPPKGARGLFENPQVPLTTGEVGTSDWLVSIAAAEAAAQCVYVLRTAAPNMWRPLLRLRQCREVHLNLAHAGTASAGLCRYDLLKDSDLKLGSDGRSEVRYLIQWPPVGGAKWFSKLFPLAVKERLKIIIDRIISITELTTDPAPKPTDLPGLFFTAIPFVSTGRPFHGDELNTFRAFWSVRVQRPTLQELFRASERISDDLAWKVWIDKFTGLLGPDWLTQSLDLVREYPNVYTDISFFSADLPTLRMVLTRLFHELSLYRETLGRKVIFGTDWFLTETEGVSAWQLWRTVREAFDNALPNQEECWEDLISRNALRFLNLGPRFSQWEAFFEQNEGLEGEFVVGLQPWWRNVKRWYQNQPAALAGRH
jgi:hypothetical protein